MNHKKKNDDNLLIKVNSKDNVKTVVKDGGIKLGTKISNNLKTKEYIPQGHKVSLRNLNKGDQIIKYGEIIGYASKKISEGSWINEKNMSSPNSPSLNELTFATNLKKLPPLEKEYNFLGYKNENGSVGTKNMLGIVSCVQCVEGVLNKAVEKIKKEILPQYPNVDGIVPVNHNYGCGVAIDAEGAEVPIRTIRNLAKNPNLGEIIVVSLGCEKLFPERLFENSNIDNINVIVLQKINGFEKIIQTVVNQAKKGLKRLNKRNREVCPASDLVIGLQCGGSDAFSGITANPAVGYASDLLVRAGATVIFSEVTEVRDGLHLLAPRIINQEEGDKLKIIISWYDKYLEASKVDRSANPTPGNIKGGLANIVEKSLGSIKKSGTAPIVEVLMPGEKVNKKGLVFAATPASDFICGTLQLASGITLQVFTTGKGTPYGLSMAPVIKVSSRTELKKSWNDLIDIDAGKIATGELSYKDVGENIFNLILEIASGKKETKADYWGIENRLCLFNPAPIT